MDENKERSYGEQIANQLYLEIHELIKRASVLDDTLAQKVNREVQQLLIEKHSSAEISAEETLDKIYDIFINNAIFVGPNEDFLQSRMTQSQEEITKNSYFLLR